MRILFKTGKEIPITQEIAQEINKKLMKGARQWQTFSDSYDNVILMVNLDEVECITSLEAKKE